MNEIDEIFNNLKMKLSTMSLQERCDFLNSKGFEVKKINSTRRDFRKLYYQRFNNYGKLYSDLSINSQIEKIEIVGVRRVLRNEKFRDDIIKKKYLVDKINQDTKIISEDMLLITFKVDFINGSSQKYEVKSNSNEYKLLYKYLMQNNQSIRIEFFCNFFLSHKKYNSYHDISNHDKSLAYLGRLFYKEVKV